MSASTGRSWSGHGASPDTLARTSALASTTGGLDAAAAASGESEIAALRTQSSRTFVEPDGSRRLVAAKHPLNYRGASGAWQPIDDS